MDLSFLFLHRDTFYGVRVLTPGAPKLCLRATKVSSKSPCGPLNMEFSFPFNLSSDFNLLKKSVKKSFTQ